MNNNKKHRAPRQLGSEHSDGRQQPTRGPLRHDFPNHQAAASTPGPTGHNEGAAVHENEERALLHELEHNLHHLAKELRKKGVKWAKDSALDTAFDKGKDKLLDVLKKLKIVGERSAFIVTLATDFITKAVEVNHKLTAEWVKAHDPGVEPLEVKGGAPSAVAVEKVLKDGGMVFETSDGGLFWSKDPNYHPNSATISSVRANPTSEPDFDDGNHKPDGRPPEFGHIVLKVIILELVYDRALGMLVDKGAESHSPMSKWLKKTVLEYEKKLAMDEFEELLRKSAIHRGHHPPASPKPGPSPTKPGPSPGIGSPGSVGVPAGGAMSIQAGQGPKEVDGLNESDYVIKPGK